jgi:hypothetical protein
MIESGSIDLGVVRGEVTEALCTSGRWDALLRTNGTGFFRNLFRLKPDFMRFRAN